MKKCPRDEVVNSLLCSQLWGLGQKDKKKNRRGGGEELKRPTSFFLSSYPSLVSCIFVLFTSLSSSPLYGLQTLEKARIFIACKCIQRYEEVINVILKYRNVNIYLVLYVLVNIKYNLKTDRRWTVEKEYNEFFLKV